MEIFDIHIHFPRNWEDPDADPEPLLDRLDEVAMAAGLTKGYFLSRRPLGHHVRTHRLNTRTAPRPVHPDRA